MCVCLFLYKPLFGYLYTLTFTAKDFKVTIYDNIHILSRGALAPLN